MARPVTGNYHRDFHFVPSSFHTSISVTSLDIRMTGFWSSFQLMDICYCVLHKQHESKHCWDSEQNSHPRMASCTHNSSCNRQATTKCHDLVQHHSTLRYCNLCTGIEWQLLFSVQSNRVRELTGI